MGENIYKSQIWYAVSIQNIRIYATKYQKSPQIQLKKWVDDLNRLSYKEDTQTANRYLKKCSISLSLQKWTSESEWDIASELVKHVGKAVEKMECLCSVDWNANWYSYNVKESACNAGDPSSIPGSGRSTWEGIGYPLQYSWVSLVAQLVKNLPAMQETWIRSLAWEDPLGNGKATHSGILAWRIPWTV